MCIRDRYWSDHCRHTTFSTELKDVTFGEGDYKEPIVNTYKQYLSDHSEIFKGREDKFVCLMDLALMAMRKLKKEGKLADQEESDEINACSIVVPIKVDGVEEEWLINFKNETHNHPTEIEPFGGAATDVYKRQIYDNTHQEFLVHPAGKHWVPVSYTHLDVYKRQILRCI